jgi:hypothetical protein
MATHCGIQRAKTTPHVAAPRITKGKGKPGNHDYTAKVNGDDHRMEVLTNDKIEHYDELPDSIPKDKAAHEAFSFSDVKRLKNFIRDLLIVECTPKTGDLFS